MDCVRFAYHDVGRVGGRLLTRGRGPLREVVRAADTAMGTTLVRQLRLECLATTARR
jgi:hypothetical protein